MSLYRRKDSPIWWASISVPGRPRLRVPTGTTDRTEAQRTHDRLQAEQWAKPKAQHGPYLSTIVLTWCQVEGRGLPDIQAIRKFLRVYGDRPLPYVLEDRDGIDKAMRSFIKTPGNYTRYRNRLHAIFQLAKDDEVIDVVPSLKKWTANRIPPARWVHEEQFPLLMKELAEHQRPMVLFAVHTGMRQSNVLGLKWSQVDLKRKIAWVHAIDAKANKTLSIPLNDTAVLVLESQLGKHDTYVFVYQGRPIKEIKTAFQKACERAGLGEITVIPNKKNKCGFTRHYKGLRWHDLRHTFASWHVKSGTPPQVLKELGGWSSMQMVERYTHLAPSFVASYANNITKTS